ncbi:MAG: PAS domain S-box protein [Isosphaeraceae bacterium]
MPASTAGRPEGEALTRSGFYDSPIIRPNQAADGQTSAEYSIIDMVNRLDPERFRWVQSSLAEQRFLGWDFERLRSMSFLDIVQAEDRARAEEALRQATAQGEIRGLRVRIRNAFGRQKVIELHASARYMAGDTVSYLRCHLEDVTERLRLERERQLQNQELSRVNHQLRAINRELSQLKDRYRDLYEHAPAMYFSLDLRGRITECNETFLRTLDRRREEMIHQGFERFLDPSDLDRCRAVFARLLSSGSIETECRWVKAGGEPIDVWLSGTVVQGPRGEVEHMRCVAQDVTARHRLEAELRETNRSLALANRELSAKNRELDEFVYVVSHDLQEPVRSLIAFSTFLLEDCGPQLDATGKDHVRRLSGAAHRMRSMIQGLLNLSRAGKVIEGSEPVELSELFEVVRTDLSELIRDRHAEVHLLGSGGTVWGDRRRIQQLLTNLVSNAIKYNRSDVPRVEVGVARPAGSPPTGPSLTLFVRDNGIGIDPKQSSKIFQLFRRLHTQEEFPGTGVGLAICNKIVLAHGGEIRIDSQPGEGSTFYVSLPAGPGMVEARIPREEVPAFDVEQSGQVDSPGSPGSPLHGLIDDSAGPRNPGSAA